ncbi:MAG: ABC transporter permease [Gemmatimonadota bacterium]
MPILSTLRALWRNLRHTARADYELDAELQGFLAGLVDEKIRAGLAPDAARREALLTLGGMEQVRESVREVRAGAWWGALLRDARYAFRSLRRTPGFTAAAVLALGLGIGATAAIYTVVSSVLLRPLNYPGADRLVVLLHDERSPVAPANFLDLRRASRSFQGMGAAEMWGPNLSGQEPAEKIPALHVTADLFPLLRVKPLLGRVFRPDETELGHEHVVVLSYGLWQRRFGGDPAILARTILLDGESYQVIGVMPREFGFAPFWATNTQLWAPKAFTAEAATSRGAQSLRVFARLRDGVSLAAAQADVSLISGRIEQRYPGVARNITVRTLQETVVGRVRPALLVMLGAVAVLLLMACANVAHMLLARAATRQREVAVRSAIGATRERMVRQFLTESLVLSGLGCLAGLLLAWTGTRAIVAWAPGTLPRATSIAMDWQVVGFTLVLGIVTGLIFGLAPAWQSAGQDPNTVLRDGARGSTEGGVRARARDVLVGSQFAFAVVLLVGAGLLARSFLALQRVDPGFVPDGVTTMIVSTGGTREAQPTARAEFFREVLRRIQAIPGVAAAGAINHIPVGGDTWGQSFWIEGRPPLAPGERQGATWRIVLPGYFATMRIPLTRGRDVTDQDRIGAPGVVIVNQYLADHYWPGEDPVGKRLTIEDPAKGAQWLTVVGVARNAVQGEWSAPASEELYLPFLQDEGFVSGSGRGNYFSYVVRTAGNPASVVPAIRAAVAEIDPAVPLSAVATMDELIAAATGGPRFYLFLLGSFAVVALTLAAVGVYGVMSYAVSRRSHEIGIRMALGADPAKVRRDILRRGLLVAMAGAAVGVFGALLFTRAMATLLYGVTPGDPLTFVVVPAILALVALVASYLPARRATRIDPLVALRLE